MPNFQIGGFIPVQSKSGENVNRRVPVASSAPKIRMYDAVVTNGTTFIAATSVNTAVDGSSQGASYVDTNGNRVDRPMLPALAFTGSGIDPVNQHYIYIPDDPLATIYKASIDEAVTYADINLNFVMILPTTANNYSDHELDATGKAVTATFPWRLRDIVVGNPASDPAAADAMVLVQINRGLSEPALSLSTGS